MSYSVENNAFARQLGLSPDTFQHPRVIVQLPPGQETRLDAVAGFMLAANLSVRLFRKVHLLAPDVPVGENPWGISNVHGLAEPLAALSEGYVEWTDPGTADVAIGIGAPPTVNAKRRTWVEFSGWEVALDMPLDQTEKGVMSALFAVCYGCAQAFLHATDLVGGTRQPIAPFHMSLLDYSAARTNAAVPADLGLGDVHLVGVGAVGCATVYALSCIPTVSGRLFLIDNDKVDESNLNRYILMRRADVGREKPKVGNDALARTGLTLIPSCKTFQEFAKESNTLINLLLSPVDSKAGRRKLAAYLPRMILNAATGNSSVTISRHGFADGKACLHCLYLPKIDEMSPEKRLATDLGLSEMEVGSLLADNIPVDRDLIRHIERFRAIPEGALDPWIGLHLQSFYQRAVCGSAPVGTVAGATITPLSFISAMAGVLLAVELVKLKTPSLEKYSLDNYFRLDTLYAPNPSVREAKLSDKSGRCICCDEQYVRVYRRRYADN